MNGFKSIELKHEKARLIEKMIAMYESPNEREN